MTNTQKNYGVITNLDTQDESITWFAEKSEAISFYRYAITYTEALIEFAAILYSTEHRALDDCRLVADLLGKVPYLDYQLERAARPKLLVNALVSFEDKGLAKAAGFHWDSVLPRAWAKRMPEDDANALPFAVEVLG